MHIDKQQLVQHIIRLLRTEAEHFTHAARTAHADATDEESRSENKYDTRGLEASYLAGAQAGMAAQAVRNIVAYETLILKMFSADSLIALTALVEIESEEGVRSVYFLGPNGGGTKIEYEGTTILIITPSSPIGGRLLGRRLGDCIKVPLGSVTREYEIVSIC